MEICLMGEERVACTGSTREDSGLPITSTPPEDLAGVGLRPVKTQPGNGALTPRNPEG
jgi:hypothetical protein